jgi:hypothetical protein
MIGANGRAKLLGSAMATDHVLRYFCENPIMF